MENQSNEHANQARALDVARYLLDQKGTLTGFQLQKLLYYCQAWSLVINDRPLFSDEIKAYRNGPSVPAVSMLHMHQRYVHPSDIAGNASMLSEEDMALIDTVLSAYDGLSGDQLRDLTHREDPWLQSYNKLTGIDASAVIPHDLMRSYYAKLRTASDEEQWEHHVPSFDHPKIMYVSASDFDWLLGYLDSEE